MSPLEKKLTEELEKMKAMVEELKNSGGGEGGGPSPEVEALRDILALKQKELEQAAYADMGGAGGGIAEAMKEEQERYAQRGMSLAYFDKPGEEGNSEEHPPTTHPYLINLDEDSFR